MDKEVWKDIRDFPKYQISNRGRTRSWKRDGYIMLQGTKTRDGYLVVALYKNLCPHWKRVHRLVLEAFIGCCPKDHQANHRDGKKLNNCISNLEWITQGQNQSHAFMIGLRSSVGEKGPNAKLKEGEVWLIKRLLWFEQTQHKIAKMFRVSRSCICHISGGSSWTHVKFIPTDEDRTLYKTKFCRWS